MNDIPDNNITRRSFVQLTAAAGVVAIATGGTNATAQAQDPQFSARLGRVNPQIGGPIDRLSKPNDGLIKLQCPTPDGGNILLSISRGTNEQFVSTVVTREKYQSRVRRDKDGKPIGKHQEEKDKGNNQKYKEGDEMLVWRTTIYGHLPNGMKPDHPNAQPAFDLKLETDPADPDRALSRKGAIEVWHDIVGGEKISIGTSETHPDGGYTTTSNNPNGAIVIEVDITGLYQNIDKEQPVKPIVKKTAPVRVKQ